jgi:NADPH-dependent ferric siderophore reductase
VSGHLDRIARARAGTCAEQVDYPNHVRELRLLRTQRVGAAIVRLTLGGPGLAGFESHSPEEHVKIVLPDADGTVRLPRHDGQRLRWPRPLPPARQYTVRRHDAVAGELDVDVVLHEGGLGADWAAAVEPGTPVHVVGPPSGVIVPDVYDRYLLVGDMSALPAIARWLEEIPRAAAGWAFVEVTDAGDEIPLTAPDGVEVRWLHRGAGVPPGTGDALERAVRGITVPAGERIFAFVAGEAGAVAPLRRLLRGEMGLTSADSDITGYWRRGVTADEDD